MQALLQILLNLLNELLELGCFLRLNMEALKGFVTMLL
jgi:hypothetical protein